MCRELDIAPSGYYACLGRAPSKKSVRDAVELLHVRAAYKASHRRYGSPRVHADLRAARHRVARKRVGTLMRQDGGISATVLDGSTRRRHHLPVTWLPRIHSPPRGGSGADRLLWSSS